MPTHHEPLLQIRYIMSLSPFFIRARVLNPILNKMAKISIAFKIKIKCEGEVNFSENRCLKKKEIYNLESTFYLNILLYGRTSVVFYNANLQ